MPTRQRSSAIPVTHALTDLAAFGPTHPVTRLGRVVQQLRSFADLHAAELESLAAELDAADLPELGARVRVFRDVQRDEGQLVVDELADIQSDMASAEPAEESAQETDPEPWKASPKRAQWLAEQTRPRSRRDFFSRG